MVPKGFLGVPLGCPLGSPGRPLGLAKAEVRFGRAQSDFASELKLLVWFPLGGSPPRTPLFNVGRQFFG